MLLTAMRVTAIEACQGCQTVAKTLQCLTYRTYPECETNVLPETIMIFRQNITRAGGNQTKGTKYSISNDI